MLHKPQGHKYNHGHALILSGGAGQTGAARLAARAALRIGAGVVTLGVPPSAQLEVAMQITAVMLSRVKDAAALETLLQDQRINALCLGPGLGLSDEKQGLIEVALKSGRACVLDADALTLIARVPALFALLHAACVLTPHGGEFARLFPKIAGAEGQNDIKSKAEATRRAASDTGCTILLKGADTFIADQTGLVMHHHASGNRAAPWLATAGAGDVLAGLITGLLARGIVPLKAAANAAWLHVESARHVGPGLIAEDLSEALPFVLNAFSERTQGPD